MFVQMLCGEQLDLAPEMFSIKDEETNESKNITEMLDLPRHTSSEAYACVHDLLENDPKKRLGSSTSPHGPIRDHPFFQAGRRIDWQEIDDGIFKSFTKNTPVQTNSRSNLIVFFNCFI